MQRLNEFEPLLSAELKLVEQAGSGTRVEIGDGTLPLPDATDVEIRGALVRLILLGLDPAAVPHANS